MARRRLVGTRSALRQGQRRIVEWFAGPATTVTTNLAASTVLLHSSFNAAAVALLPFTIMRTRGELWVFSDQDAATRTPFGAIGISVVSAQALAAGVASVPDPITDEGSDLFFLHQFWMAHITVLSSVGFQGGDFLSRYSFDSKAMRKVSIDQQVAVVIANQAATGGINFVWRFRMLVKLH